MMDNELKYKVNLSFVIFNLLEDIFMDIRHSDKIRYEFKQNVNSTLLNLRKFNSMAEKILTNDNLDSFDEDKQTLMTLIKHELVAHDMGKQKEFLTYIKQFFTNE